MILRAVPFTGAAFEFLAATLLLKGLTKKQTPGSLRVELQMLKLQ